MTLLHQKKVLRYAAVAALSLGFTALYAQNAAPATPVQTEQSAETGLALAAPAETALQNTANAALAPQASQADAEILPEISLPVPVAPKNGAKAVPDTKPASGQSPSLAAVARGPNDLPLPKVKINAPRLQTASAVQVAASTATVPASAQNSSLAAAKAGSASTVKTPVESPAPSSTNSKNAPVAPAPSATPKPVASQTPVAATPKPSASPVVSVAVAPRPSPTPVAVATPKPVPGVNRTVVDTTKQPEYSIVPAPVPSPVPGSASSLPTSSQQLVGVTGQNVDMVLNGRGWIYMGTGKTPSGVTLIEKSVMTDSEQFKFRLDTPGQLLLQFQRQDLRSGLVEKYQVNLSVASKSGNSAALASLNALTAVSGLGADFQTEGSDALINPGLISALASSYVPQYSVPRDPLKQATSNGVSIVASPRPSAAPATQTTNNAAFQQNGARSNSLLAQPEHAGLQVNATRNPVAPSPAPVPATAQTAAYAEPAILPTDAEGLYKLGIARENAKRDASAREAYENLVSVYPEYERADDAMFRLAKLLESSSDNRNLRRAFDLYVKLQSEYPYSKLYGDARERARYLSRMFLKS